MERMKKRMKKIVNFKVRIKNPMFWVGIIGMIISAVGVAPETLTSWASVGDMLIAFVSNPVAIGSFVMGLLGIIVDPTTSGLKDSTQAMQYTCPKK